MRENQIYSLYSNNEFVFRGNHEECAKFLGVSKGAFTSRLNGHCNCEYTIVEGSMDGAKEKAYQRVVKHLKMYGNTIAKHYKDYICDRLTTDGFTFKTYRGIYGNYLVIELCKENN